ncbi:MAG: ABC transporter permease [Clostridia bacterium]|nr:ABC transporter permease [Clostridia bacterium]
MRTNNNSRAARVLKWFYLLAKRLFLKKSFVALLLLIPVLSGIMAYAAKEDSGIMTVALVAEGGGSELSHKISDYLTKNESIVNFKVFDAEEDAKDAVFYGKADAAWVFPAGLDELFTRYASGDDDIKAARVYQSEETPIQRIVREKLNGAIFLYFSDYILHEMYDEKLDGKYSVDDYETMKAYCEEESLKVDLVEFEYIGARTDKADNSNYLTSPLRGLALLASLLCTLASSLYCMRDEKEGFFSRIPVRRRLPVFFASNLAASLSSSAVMLISLALTGTISDVAFELLAALAFALASASFCTLLCRIFTTPFALGASIPPITLASAALCPIFVSVRFAGRLDLLFPVTYGIKAVRSPVYLLYALVFSVVTAAAAFALDLFRRSRS